MRWKLLVGVIGGSLCLYLLYVMFTAFAQMRARSQEPAGQAPVVVIDKVMVELHLRRINLWDRAISVQIADPKPSLIPGLFQLDVVAKFGPGITIPDLIYVSGDGSRLIRGEMVGLKEDTYQSYLDKLDVSERPRYGSSAAPVQIIIFGDFQCQSCKEEAATLRTEIPKTYPQAVAVYFFDYPLEQRHPWSKMAAIAGRCVYRQNPEAFWKYHDWVFDHQSKIDRSKFNEMAAAFIVSRGLNQKEFKDCNDRKLTEAEVDHTIAIGQAIRLNALPTIFVNGRRVTDTRWLNLREVIDFEIKYRDKGYKDLCNCEIPEPQTVPKKR
jgi:protein-disulfide isomerase